LSFYNDANLIMFKQSHLVKNLIGFIKTTHFVVYIKTISPKMGNHAVTPSSIPQRRKDPRGKFVPMCTKKCTPNPTLPIALQGLGRDSRPLCF